MQPYLGNYPAWSDHQTYWSQQDLWDAPGTREEARGTGSWEAMVASLVTFAIALFAAYGVMFGIFFTISRAIRREDKVGTLTGNAPSWACRSARIMTGWHRSRWA
jgi:hypothetical protein